MKRPNCDPAYGILWPRIADLPMMHPHPPVDPMLAWSLR